MSDPLREVARRHGPRRALADRGAGYWVSWFDLDGLAHAWARRFEAAGLQPGERVAVVEPAGVRFAALLHACLRTGSALVPISPRAPLPEVARILADCRPRLLVRRGQVEALAGPAAGPPGDACVIYTSGTTSAAKGVRLTLANHVASAEGCRAGLGGGESDRWLLLLSPHHVGGLAIFMRSVLGNQPLVTMAAFDAEPALAAIAQEHVTLLSVVPTMLIQMLAAGGAETLSGVRAILVGGGPAPAAQVREWAALGLNVCPSYGLTETCSQVATVPPGRAGELAGTAGMVASHATISIEAGEIVVAGPSVSPGYVNTDLSPRPEAGRFPTGDLGSLAGGVLTVTGRRDDAIISGGENVRPEEVEEVLRAHPAVVDAAVAGIPDPTWGELVGAWLVAPRAPPVAELEAWCRARLAPFKVPRRWRLVQTLPRSRGGKLLRRQLPD